MFNNPLFGGSFWEQYSFAKRPFNAANAPEATARMIQRDLAWGWVVGRAIIYTIIICGGGIETFALKVELRLSVRRTILLPELLPSIG